MLEPAETRRQQDPVDRNGLAQKNTGSLQAAKSEEWNCQEYTGGNNNQQNPEKNIYMVRSWFGQLKIIDSHTRRFTATLKVWEAEEDKGKRGLTWKKIRRRKMQTLKQRWNWYKTDGSGGFRAASSSARLMDENKEESERRMIAVLTQLPSACVMTSAKDLQWFYGKYVLRKYNWNIV